MKLKITEANRPALAAGKTFCSADILAAAATAERELAKLLPEGARVGAIFHSTQSGCAKGIEITRGKRDWFLTAVGARCPNTDNLTWIEVRRTDFTLMGFRISPRQLAILQAGCQLA